MIHSALFGKYKNSAFKLLYVLEVHFLVRSENHFRYSIFFHLMEKLLSLDKSVKLIENILILIYRCDWNQTPAERLDNFYFILFHFIDSK